MRDVQQAKPKDALSVDERSKTMLLVRASELDARVRAFADELALASGYSVAFVMDERDGRCSECDRQVVGISVEGCEAIGLFCPIDFAWKCGDYGYYLARRRFPAVERFWLIEYDVRFSGEPAEFFAAFERHPTIDLIAPYLEKAGRDWFWAITARARDVEPRRCLFPVTRLSAPAIDTLLAKRVEHSRRRLRRMLWPNDEAMVATTLMHDGFACRDLNDFGSTYYDARTFSFTSPIAGDAYRLLSAETRVFHPVLYDEQYQRKLARLSSAVPEPSFMSRRVTRIAAKLNGLTAW